MEIRRLIQALLIGLVASVLVGVGAPTQAQSHRALDLDCAAFPSQRAAQTCDI